MKTLQMCVQLHFSIVMLVSAAISAFDWMQQESNDFAAVFTLWSAL